ncbi:MAG: hypothetical protein IPK82_14185 [Polyangiaceae bacterium]|nr:hypothetical protein [Polyangiaceae bacterium]
MRTQRWSAVLLLLTIGVGAHVAMPSQAAAKALIVFTIVFGTVHAIASLYILLTDQRFFAPRTKLLTAALIMLGGLAIVFGTKTVAATNNKPPTLGHIPGVECTACHIGDEHKRWPLELHAPTASNPGVSCEGCHAVNVLAPKLLAYRDSKTGAAVGTDVEELVCLDCHGPHAPPAFKGAIHENIKCGTCHSRVSTHDDPSWKRACVKCHPQDNDPHGDVRLLDTTYLSSQSAYDIHRVTCQSCHR